jgi:asparagine synthase (glutamine-hydrolysing)
MCGIAGYFGTNPPSQQAIDNTLNTIKRRGPDSQSVELSDLGGGKLCAIHGRLSILDLDPRSNQPFRIGDYSIIFNGEIYNYLEIRASLEKKGIKFRTTSDTEVLLHCYIEYGPKCVELFEGMWAFAIADEKRGELFISRDRFGEKPLYIHETTSGIYFASEIKLVAALANQKFPINNDQVLRYLVYGYKFLNKKGEQFFKDISEISPATNVTLSLTKGQLKKHTSCYWSPESHQVPMTRDQAVQGTREHVLESVKLRLRSDVPLAFCLSGGIDSGSIVSIASKIYGCNTKCFSIIDSDSRYDERENIRATANDVGADLVEVYLEKETSFDRLRDLIRYHDAPVATISYYIHSFLSKAIYDSGYKVVFSGTAADELFTGYYDHHLMFLRAVNKTPEYLAHSKSWESYIKPIVRNPHLSNPDLFINDPSFRGHITLGSEEIRSFLVKDFQEEFTERSFTEDLLRNRMMNEIFFEATRVILHEDDLNSMYNSLENRSPFLDTKLFSFAFSIPTQLLINNGYGKSILRDAMSGILNDKVRLDRQKKGFNASINSVFALSDKQIIDFLMTDSPLFNLIKREAISKHLGKAEIPNSVSKFLFNIINAKLFLEMFS